MKDTGEAWGAIARATGQGDVRPNSDGFVEMRLQGGVPLYFEEIDAREIEVSCRVPALGAQPDAATMRAMLAWNAANAPFRLGLEEGRGALLGRRIDVRTVDAPEMLRRMGTVAVEAAKLEVAGLDGLPVDPAPQRSAAPAEGDLLRI